VRNLEQPGDFSIKKATRKSHAENNHSIGPAWKSTVPWEREISGVLNHGLAPVATDGRLVLGIRLTACGSWFMIFAQRRLAQR